MVADGSTKPTQGPTVQELTTNWLLVLGALFVGFVLGRLTAKSPIERDRQRKAYEAELRQHKSHIRQDTTAAVTALLRDGKKIDAIVRVRADLGIGLKEAKDLVEAWPGQPR